MLDSFDLFSMDSTLSDMKFLPTDEEMTQAAPKAVARSVVMVKCSAKPRYAKKISVSFSNVVY